jgi:hypothetical protein
MCRPQKKTFIRKSFVSFFIKNKLSWFSIMMVISGCSLEQKEPVVVNGKTDSGNGQIIVNKKPVSLNFDQSPLDMVYYPSNFPQIRNQQSEERPKARVIYSRPQLNGRKGFGNLVKYGQPWRLGANEATELELFEDGLIGNVKVNAGKYILYCIPHEQDWTIVLNSNLFSWGLQFDPTKDVAKLNVPVQTTDQTMEAMTMEFILKNEKIFLRIEWENCRADIPFSFPK